MHTTNGHSTGMATAVMFAAMVMMVIALLAVQPAYAASKQVLSMADTAKSTQTATSTLTYAQLNALVKKNTGWGVHKSTWKLIMERYGGVCPKTVAPTFGDVFTLGSDVETYWFASTFDHKPVKNDNMGYWLSYYRTAGVQFALYQAEIDREIANGGNIEKGNANHLVWLFFMGVKDHISEGRLAASKLGKADPEKFVTRVVTEKLAIKSQKSWCWVVQGSDGYVSNVSFDDDCYTRKGNYLIKQSRVYDHVAWYKEFKKTARYSGNVLKKNAPKLTAKAKPVNVYRVYDPRTGEHHYTKDLNEKNTLVKKHGWKYEGVAWKAASKSSTPVYRLYSKKSGAHHYTTNLNEKNTLVKKHGWKYEGVAWYADDQRGTRVYRLYKASLPPIANHHFTTSYNEYETLVYKHGWKFEGIAWFGM